MDEPVQETPRPNLFVIGAAKSGTTSLHRYLDSHPDVFMCYPKEPAIFVPEYRKHPRDMDWYLSLFEDAGDATVIGESSTFYTMLPTFQGVPARIKDFAPEARLIYLMRDPVERAISHYWHRVRKSKERRPIEVAVKANVEYVAFSDYECQLVPYFETFGRDAILTLTFEELTGRPVETMQRVFEWLGVEPTVDEEVVQKKWNTKPDEQKYVRGRGLLHRFRFTSVWNGIAPILPQAVKDIGKKVALKSVEPGGAPPEVEDYLRSQLQPSVERLRELLDRSFPEWTSVDTNGGERRPEQAESAV